MDTIEWMIKQMGGKLILQSLGVADFAIFDAKKIQVSTKIHQLSQDIKLVNKQFIIGILIS